MDEDRISQGPAAASAVTIRGDVGLESIGAAEWDALVGGSPLVSHAFLSALHETGCASRASGWTPCYLTAWREDELAGALPLYEKTHSYGEYVFDWAWANAYHRHGRHYFPKLVAAIPFTPAEGPRFFGATGDVRDALLRAALARLRSSGRRGDAELSSLHVLFPTEAEARACEAAGMTVRNGVQFRWENGNYRDFADFLATFNHDKRKKVKQERRRVAESGIAFTRKVGREITASDWEFFYLCYERTYREHRATPYLSLAFFERIAAAMPDHLMLALGSRGERRICAALDVFDAGTLWGRYWGTLETVSGLHFEACYYQAIEFCIERGIERFEGGAQGAHKLARGLVPITTWSAHAIADREFARAIAALCARERVDVAHAIDELDAAKPFRNPQPAHGPA
jgi:predicted N-acyltransferase